MYEKEGRQPLTLVLVLGAMVFGMVLAGGIDLTPASVADEGMKSASAVHVEPATGGLPGFADLAAAVSPAVVSIRATKIEESRPNDLLDLFNRQRRRQPEPAPERRSDSSGSGFVISADGLIVTNHHVIEDATGLVVVLDGREYQAEVQGDDPATDLALLKIKTEEPLKYLEFADSEDVRVGQWLMVIGSPLQLANSVSVGVVSAKGRSINITREPSFENFIQTDAAINFGNSGGPLVDLNGQVIGIATAVNFGAENIGFAVPANTLKTILPQLRDNGVVRRGYLGVNISDLDHEEAEAFGLPSTDGALVTQVVADGPAEAGGLRHGDIIVEVQGKGIANNRELIDRVSAMPPGKKVKLRVFRGGDYVDKQITLGERPGVGAAPVPVEDESPSSIEWLGVEYQPLTAQIRTMHNMPSGLNGVWITDVAPTSPLFEEGVRKGDVVVDVNGQAIDGAEALESAVGGVGSGEFLRLYVSRFDPRTGELAFSFYAIVRVP